MTDHATSNPAKPRARRRPPPMVPDPADLGTAFGMELSIDPPDGSPLTAASTRTAVTPTPWYRRWLASRHR